MSPAQYVAGDMQATLDLYEHFKTATGDAGAASNLTLAHAVMHNGGWAEREPEKLAGTALTVRQAAELLGVGERTVRDLIYSGKLKHHRIGRERGTIRILPCDLQEFLDDSRAVASEPTTPALRHLRRE